MKIIKFTLPYLALLSLSSCREEAMLPQKTSHDQHVTKGNWYIANKLERLEDKVRNGFNNITQELENVNTTKTYTTHNNYKTKNKLFHTGSTFLSRIAWLSALGFSITTAVGLCVNPIVNSSSILGIGLIGLAISLSAAMFFTVLS